MKKFDKNPTFEYPNYAYRAELVHIVDGDTIDVKLDLGFDITTVKRLRFLHLDAWETRGVEKPQGLLAKARIIELLDSADKLYVSTVMDAEGKYGRVLAWVWIEVDSVVSNINLVLLEEGHGDIYGS